ncbi:MAG: hypothetical protein IKA00_14425 [Prevotella sp.]|nr:hypothetical protein [Prevotella sp.]
MNSNEQTLTVFQTRIHQLILQFQALKKENEELYAMLYKNEKDISDLKEKLIQASNDYDSLKMAKMVQITDGDLETSKKRLSKLIRDVNKCIAVLSEQK